MTEKLTPARKRELALVAALTAISAAWMYVGELALLLGAVIVFEEERRARGAALYATFITCSVGYGFLPAVGSEHGFFGLAALGYLGSLLLAIAPSQLAIALTFRVTRSLGARAAVLPLAWALASALTPMVFPFRPAYLAVTSRPLSQWLAVGGPSLLDAIVVGVGTSLVLLLRGQGRTRWLAAGFMLAAFLGGLGLFEQARAARRPSVEIGIVAPAITLEEGRDDATRLARLARLHALTEPLDGVSLVVWPESVYPYPVRSDTREDVPPPHGARPAGLRAPLLVGAAVGDVRCRRTSSVVLIDPAGHLTGRIDKERLMPFGDVVPFRAIPSLAAAFPCGTREGERFTPLTVGAMRVGAMLCYDEVHPGVARRRVLAGANVLVSSSNDAWYAGTDEPALHARVARVRAIETRRDLVRAVNMGEGGLVAATGEELEWTSGTEPDARRVRVALSAERTPYVRMGWGIEAILAVILAGILASGRRAAAAPAA